MANSGTTYITSGGEGTVPQYFGVYQGVVVRNDDPHGNGSLIITIPQLGSLQTGWAPSLTPYRSLPIVGTGVYVLFAGGMVEYPVWTGQWSAPGQPASLGIDVTYSQTAPTSANDGDVWFQTDADGDVEGMYQYQVNAAVPSDNGWVEFNLNGSILAAGTIISNTIFASGQIEGATVTAGSIQSPNYVSGSAGWAINSDGSAQFNDITLPAGTGGSTVVFSGSQPTDPVDGEIWYDTSNGLLASVYTASTGTWTSYQIGSGAIEAGTVVAGIVDGTTIEGAQFVAYGDEGEILIYSGTPASGNLIASISATAGTDDNGNAYPAGLTMLGTTLQTEQSNGSGAKIDQYGNYFSFGEGGCCTFLLIPGTGWFIYKDTGTSTQGSLLFSATSAAGTDQWNNAYKAGFTFYGADDTSVQIFSLGSDGSAETWYSTGDPDEGTQGIVGTGIGSSGSTRTLDLYLQSPTFNNNTEAYSYLQLYSPSYDNETTSSSLSIGAQDGTSSDPDSVYAQWSLDANATTPFAALYTSATTAPTNASIVVNSTGQLITDKQYAMEPGQTEVIPETWHSVTSFSNSWSLSTVCRYKLYPDNTVAIQAEIVAPSSPGNPSAIFTLPSGYLPTADIQIPVVTHLAASPYTATGGTLRVTTGGVVEIYGATPGANILPIDVRFPLD